MDWLTFKLCVLIWVLCISTSKSQSQLFNSTSSLSNQLRSACEDGLPIVPPDECNVCICFSGQKYCTNMPCPEQDCVNGVDVPQPDGCNKCICRRGKVKCSNMICIPAPHCAENQLYPAQNKCNACMCMNGFITCTTNTCPEEPLPSAIPKSTDVIKATTKKPKRTKKCIEGEPLPGQLECSECFCHNGRKRCKNVCNTNVKSRFREVESLQMSEPKCVRGQHIPRLDDCNNCICFEGQIHCTHWPCRMDIRIGPECTDNQPVFRPDECNECYCFEGRLACSDLVCIRGSKCVQGQVIPKPDGCNTCKCVEGHILCTNHQCPTLNSRNVLRPGRPSTELRILDECQEGDLILPPPPPNDCNTCYCIDNRILCTMNSCEGSDPEIKGGIREPNEQTNLEIFDKQISVEPFINMLSKNYEKLPTKLIHTHAYNGFHQEIKVHASHLPKDATKFLKVLATSLDNAALASISKKILTSSHSLSNIHDLKIPLDNQVVPAKLLGEGNVLTTQSNKLITSGSQSNETILVIPNTAPFDDPNYQPVLPLISKHETIWKSVSSPASLDFYNNQQINPHSSQEEKLNVYYYDILPSMFTSIDQKNKIRNPAKFSRPDFPHRLPTKPTRNILETPNTNTQSIYPASNPKSININDGKKSYAPFSQENNQFKPILSGLENNQFKPIPFAFVFKRELLDHLPYQLIKPGHNQVFNYTLSPPIFRPGKFIVTPNDNGGQQKPSQSQFILLSKYYPNHVKPQRIQFKPNQKHFPTLNIKGIQYPLLFPNNPNPPIVAANQYKQPQFRLKPGQGSVSPLNNKGNQTNQQSKTFHPNFQINPPLINLPNQKNRISSITNESSKGLPLHSMVPNSTAHHTYILNPPQIGVGSEYAQHNSFEYEAPKIIDVNPDQEQLIPHSKMSYQHTEYNNPPHTSSEPGLDALIPKVRNKTKKYNTSDSHYEKYTKITYVSEYDPTHPAISLQILHDSNQYQNAPLTNLYEHYLPDQESQELDLTMSKVHYYLNLPNNYNQHDSWNIKNHQFVTYPHSPNDGNNTDPHSSSQSQFILSQDKKGGLNDPKSTDDLQSLFNPTHPKNNKYLSPPSQTGPTQNQHPPGVFDNRGSTNGFQYAHNAYENPRQIKHFYKLLPSTLETPQNHQLTGFYYERGAADGFFQYPSKSAEDLTHPKVKLNKSPHFDPYTSTVNPEEPEDNLHMSPNSQFGPAQKKHKPGVFNNREVKDGFEYAHNADKNPTHLKPLHKLLPFPHSHTVFGPTLIQHSPEMFDERANAVGFQYPSNSAENLIHSRGNLHNPKLIRFGPTQNQQLPGVFYERGSTDGFQYISSSAESRLHPKENIHISPNSPFGPTTYIHLPGMYPSNSTGNPTHQKNLTHPEQNKQKQSHSQVGPNHNKPTLGTFAGLGSRDSFQYSSNSDKNYLHQKENLHYPTRFHFGPPRTEHLRGVFNNRGYPGGFQYPSNSVGNPTQLKDSLHNPPLSQFLPSHNQYTSKDNQHNIHPLSKFVPNQNQQKQTIHKQPNSPIGPTQNQHLPEMFDERGSADGSRSHSAENPLHPKYNHHNPPHSQFGPFQNQHIPGEFDERGSANAFQYPSNSAENLIHQIPNKQIQLNSPFGPVQNQHLTGMFHERGSADGFQHPSNSVENPTHPKDNLHKLSHSQFLPSPNQHTPGVFDDRGSADGFHYPSISAEDSTHPKSKPPHSPLGPTQNQHTPGVFDDRGSADGFHYPSNSAENPTHPKNYPIPDSKFKQPQNQPKLSSLDDGYNNNNPFRPWMHLDHDQYKPSSFDNLLNGVHNIPWSVLDQDNNEIGSDAEMTTPRSGYKSKQDQYGPLMANNSAISNQNENTDLTDVDDNRLQIEQDLSTLFTDLTDSDSTQYNLLSKLKPDSDSDSLLLIDNIPDYYDQLYPLFKAVKKLNDPPIDDSLHSVGSIVQLDPLPFLFPGIAKILNYEPSHDKDDVSPNDNHEVQMVNPLSKLKSKLKQLPENNNGIFNWLKSKINKLLPTKDNAPVTKNDIDMTKIFNLLTKLTPSKLKHTTALQNISFSGFDPEIIENIMNDFKVDTITTKSTPRTYSTHSHENRFKSIQTISEESRPPQAPQLKYPDFHILLHQPNDKDDEDLQPYIETDGELNLATDIDSKDLSASMLPKMINPRFRHRPKDQKEECGDGTQWISNCHGCSCYFGQAMCFRLPDCKLRPMGEPMTCKPYSHFKMGCYTCECNGDGVAECDATDCNTEPSRGSTESPLPIFNEFFDTKKTNEILQYYNFYKKLPKDCPKQDLQTQYPTCEPGTSWVSSCHKCECNEGGKHECIKIDDCKLNFYSFGKPGLCKPNSKFYPKSNSMPCVECSCNDEGISYCPTADYKKH